MAAKPILWILALMIMLLLAAFPMLHFRLELNAGRRSVYLRGLVHQNVCMVVMARKELPCV